ncbi:hypothetical protein SAMN04515675_6104 [Pseudomonas costantinii]|uniref:Uncharacterized protein n=2 Tax=Pseudomonas costantinii TaxID=168469 RepID=A0A1H5JMN4_9PSED|nr:hypothetical protein SAMN04515675_6104 [Pseudomonas costantinii]
MDNRSNAMPLTKPNQQLRRDLKEAAALLKWSGVDLFVFAKRLLAAGDEQGANDLMKIALSFQDVEDRLAGYADEVKSSRITRAAE